MNAAGRDQAQTAAKVPKTVPDQRLRPRFPDRDAVLQRLGKVRSQRQAPVDAVGRAGQTLERLVVGLAGNVVPGRGPEVERPGAVGAGPGHDGEFIEFVDPVRQAAAAGEAIGDDPAAPGVR